MLGRIALYIVGICLALGGALFVIEGFVTRFDGTAVAGLLAVAIGIAAITAGTRLGRPPSADAADAPGGGRRFLGSGARPLLRIVLVVIGIPLAALGLLSFTERPSGPMAELAWILGGTSLVIGLAALYGAWSLRRRSP